MCIVPYANGPVAADTTGMVFAQSIWDQLTIDNVSSGLVRLWYALEEFVRNIGPGSLVLFAAVGGAIYYFIVRPR